MKAIYIKESIIEYGSFSNVLMPYKIYDVVEIPENDKKLIFGQNYDKADDYYFVNGWKEKYVVEKAYFKLISEVRKEKLEQLGI